MCICLSASQTSDLSDLNLPLAVGLLSVQLYVIAAMLADTVQIDQHRCMPGAVAKAGAAGLQLMQADKHSQVAGPVQ